MGGNHGNGGVGGVIGSYRYVDFNKALWKLNESLNSIKETTCEVYFESSNTIPLFDEKGKDQIIFMLALPVFSIDFNTHSRSPISIIFNIKLSTCSVGSKE